MLSASAAEWIARIRGQGLTWVLAASLLLLQYPLWLGEGGWLKVRERAHKIDTQQALNQRLKTRNAGLQAELGDLKQGRDAIEERARNELGMIAPDEWFVRVVSAHSVQSGKVNE
ncbi:MAG TPA: cell division protein FtsB [Thiobacillus sp.]|jgi:cell division protein FtsB|nr:cell division protein FtsB [Gammaproteobacteria bacterium]OYZ28788.1 MAG: cell division protein FtsB [Hydrogenophilales bacterium 16-64-40]OZA33821.1 MAG: cell division protein FtsB [Hydrogenophilales bacterium 17-64-65]HQS82797.1 cell division protein FtsB [Thiobacillus sp.]HQT35074.1 cell division protein FtsB [Thiobacillus sp.]